MTLRIIFSIYLRVVSSAVADFSHHSLVLILLPFNMTPLTRLQARIQASVSFAPLRRPTFKSYGRRSYASGKSKTQQTTQSKQDGSTDYPIPSNNAKPTLQDSRQSPIADHEGHLREDLPEDVKKHNKEMDERYDKPYNHITDGGNVEKGWKK
jgi:hypothetical protein